MDSRLPTLQHIGQVQRFLSVAIRELITRLVSHDQSKLSSPEIEVFNEFTAGLAATTYGSPEYKANMDKMRPAIEHHQRNNRHHPEWAYSSESWLSVPGYEGIYEVSNLGRVKSLMRVVRRDGDQGNLIVQGCMLALQPTPKGYLRVSLSKDGTPKNHMVHRLVAEAFLANPNHKPEVNHRNGNKSDNRLANLEWVTASENLIHAYDTELRDSSARYFVHCVELDFYTRGTVAMERELRARGYDRASCAGVWSVMDRGGKHLDLTFDGYLIEDGHPQSMIRGMTLVDLLEMIADWKAATLRHNDGDIRKSIEINQKRFGYSDDVKQILLNTVDLLETGVLMESGIR